MQRPQQARSTWALPAGMRGGDDSSGLEFGIRHIF
jgi:hypothetical protein